MRFEKQFSFCMVAVPLLLFAIAFLLCGCTKRQQTIINTGEDASSLTLLATIADGDRPTRIISHSPVPEGPQFSYRVTFSETGNAVAYLVDTGSGFKLVHNNGSGREYANIGSVVFSPDGRHLAYQAQSADGKWRLVADGREGKPFDAMLPPRFSPDGRHIAYEAKNGDMWFIVVDDKQNAGTIASYTEPEFSADSRLVIFIEAADSNAKMRLIVSDLSFKRQTDIWSIGDQLSVISKDRSRLAAVQVAENRCRVIDFDTAQHESIRQGGLYDKIDKMAFSDDGRSLAYCVIKGEKRLIVLDGLEEPLPDGQLREFPVVRPDRKGTGILFVHNGRFFLHQSFANQNARENFYDEAAELVYGRDGNHAYAAKSGKKWFLVINGNEGPLYERVEAPVFDPAGTRVAYRATLNGKRMVVIADADGKRTVQHPPYDEVFNVRFAPDGKSIAYGIQSGKRLSWKVMPL